MPKQKTQAEFLRDAKVVHGTRYDYRAVDYSKSRIPVIVVCRKHGPFRITPSNHLKGQACRRCGKERQAGLFAKPFAAFVAEARGLHGFKYKYDASSYAGARTKMRIVCRMHGVFTQSPSVHLRGAGCRKCADALLSNRTKMKLATFRSRLAEKYKGRIRHVGKTWNGIHSEILARCVTHGVFHSRPTTLLYTKFGCKRCAIEAGARGKRLTDGSVRARLKKLFGLTCEIGPIEYRGSKTPLTLRCRTHGAFTKAAEDLFAGKGCPRCAYLAATPKRIERLRRQLADTLEERKASFLSAARARHGNRYDYSKMEFRGQRRPIQIVCRVHGEIEQVAMTHLKSGCRLCANAELKGRYSEAYFQKFPELQEVPATLYYIVVRTPTERFYKVGITTTEIRLRFSHLSGLGGKVRKLAHRAAPLREAFEMEQALIKKHVAQHMYRPKISEAKRGSVVGATECFDRPLPKNLANAFFPKTKNGSCLEPAQSGRTANPDSPKPSRAIASRRPD